MADTFYFVSMPITEGPCLHFSAQEHKNKAKYVRRKKKSINYIKHNKIVPRRSNIDCKQLGFCEMNIKGSLRGFFYAPLPIFYL